MSACSTFVSKNSLHYSFKIVVVVCVYVNSKRIVALSSSQNKDTMLRVKNIVDKANGYVFGGEEERSIESLMSCAVGAEFEYEKIKDIREKYTDVDTAEAMDDENL